MAVIDKFEAVVRVEGQTCREYEDDDLNASASESTVATAARYIEAVPGREFVIRLDLGEGFYYPAHTNSLSWNVYLDGTWCTGRLMRQEEYIRLGATSIVVSGEQVKRGEQWKKYPFMFSELTITQDDIRGHEQSAKDKYKSLGTIEVQVQQYWVTGRTDPLRNSEVVTASKTISEKSLKGRAITLGAGYGEASPCQPPRDYSGFTVGSQPLAKFQFHYRTKSLEYIMAHQHLLTSTESLQDLMIIPTDDIENMTAEELRSRLRAQMARDVKDRKEKTPMVKRERTVVETDDEILEIREVKKAKKVASEMIEIDSD